MHKSFDNNLQKIAAVHSLPQEKILTICLLACSLILVGVSFFLPSEILPDEAGYLEQAHKVAYGGPNMGWNIRPYFYPIILSISQWPVKLIDMNNFVLEIYLFRFFHFFIGSLTILFVYFIAKELYEKKVIAFIATLLFGFSNLWITQSPHVMMDIPSTLFIVIAFWFFIKGLKGFNIAKNIIIAAVAYGFAAMTKFSSGFFLPAFFLIPFFTFRLSTREKKKILGLFITTSFLMLIIFIIIDHLAWGGFLSSLRGHLKYLANESTLAKQENWILYPTPFLVKMEIFHESIPLAYLIFGALGFISSIREGKAIFIFVIPYLLFFFFGYSYAAESRYFVPIVPFGAILAAKGIYFVIMEKFYAVNHIKWLNKIFHVKLIVPIIAGLSLGLFLFNMLSTYATNSSISFLNNRTIFVIGCILFIVLAWIFIAFIRSSLKEEKFVSAILSSAVVFWPLFFLLLGLSFNLKRFQLLYIISTFSLFLIVLMSSLIINQKRKLLWLSIGVVIVTHGPLLFAFKKIVKVPSPSWKQLALIIDKESHEYPVIKNIGIFAGYSTLTKFYSPTKNVVGYWPRQSGEERFRSDLKSNLHLVVVKNDYLSHIKKWLEEFGFVVHSEYQQWNTTTYINYQRFSLYEIKQHM
ncbi:MAG: ArnT family glycosyltransferase [bacterium]